MFLKFCKTQRKTSVLVTLSNKVAGFPAYNYTKTILQHWCFPVNFAKLLRTYFFRRTPPDDCLCFSKEALSHKIEAASIFKIRIFLFCWLWEHFSPQWHRKHLHRKLLPRKPDLTFNWWGSCLNSWINVEASLVPHSGLIHFVQCWKRKDSHESTTASPLGLI